MQRIEFFLSLIFALNYMLSVFNFFFYMYRERKKWRKVEIWNFSFK